MKKVNIELTKETHAKAKIISVLQGITLNNYLAEAIDKAVEKDKGILAKIKP
jgi:predicted HicB family RNase H-like nuclease